LIRLLGLGIASPVHRTNLRSTPVAARFLLRVNPQLLLVAAGGEASDAAAVRGMLAKIAMLPSPAG
jgi:hypothetical protein